MKILLTNFHPHNGGGHTTYLEYLFKELSTIDEIDIFIACPQSSKLYKHCNKINKNNTFAVNFPGKFKEITDVIKNLSTLAELIKKYQFDIIHVNGNPEHKMAMYCKLFYRQKFKIIRTKHDSKLIKSDFFSNIRYKKFMDKMIVVSNFQYHNINEKFILDKTTIIHNGIDLDYFRPQVKNLSLLKKYNIKNDNLVFVSVAGTALHKGWQYLIEAVSHIDNKQRSKIKIVLAGETPNNKVIDKYITSCNMQDNVIFTGMVDDVRDIISIGDIGFVLSTSIETISFACREMMSMGKPTIVSDYAGLHENINHGKNGWKVKKENYIELKDLIISILNSEKSYSSATRKKANEEFGIKNFIDKTIQVYKEVI